MEKKRCSKCKKEKDLSEFGVLRKSKDGHRFECKECRLVMTDKRIDYRKLKLENKKRCYRCGKIKNISLFSKRKNRNNRPSSYCRDCEKKRSKKYYFDNTESCHERNKKYLKKTNYLYSYNLRNKDRLNKKNKKWQHENRLAVNKSQRKTYRNNLQYNISKKLRASFYRTLRREYKTKSVLKILGCSISEFKFYFEGLFTDGMSWELFKMGRIHIDHIKPLVMFDLTNNNQVEEVWHFSNLQPLWGRDNISKGSLYGGIRYKMSNN